jgi:cytochrome c-type protein NapC
MKLIPKWLNTGILLTFVAGVGFAAAGSLFMHETNRPEFCVSCHSMDVVNEEYQQSIHFKNASGIQATCADCHVPQAFGSLLKAKILAAKDVYHEIVGTIDTPEKFEARRWHLANVVWDKMAASDSRECRSCHEFSSMDYEAQGRKVARRHQRAEKDGKTCIACHKGVAHVEPLPPRTVSSAL